MSEPLSINCWLWRSLLKELAVRGHGRRESGAFLLGNREGGKRRACAVAYYDDLDPRALETGIVTFHAVGFSKLWAQCRAAKLSVVADIHTHGGDASRPYQSEADRTNPMLAEPGHVALILPNFARVSPWWDRHLTAVYQYAGNYRWQDRTANGHFSVTLF